jgi:hypothetical protein
MGALAPGADNRRSTKGRFGLNFVEAHADNAHERITRDIGQVRRIFSL